MKEDRKLIDALMLETERLTYSFRRYQGQAARTANKELSADERFKLDMIGLAAEVGEIMSELQHAQEQERDINWEEMKEELGDCVWRITDACSAREWPLYEIAMENIQKLERRHPNGFSAASSAARADKQPPMLADAPGATMIGYRNCPHCGWEMRVEIGFADRGKTITKTCDRCGHLIILVVDADFTGFEVLAGPASKRYQVPWTCGHCGRLNVLHEDANFPRWQGKTFTIICQNCHASHLLRVPESVAQFEVGLDADPPETKEPLYVVTDTCLKCGRRNYVQVIAADRGRSRTYRCPRCDNWRTILVTQHVEIHEWTSKPPADLVECQSAPQK